MRRIAVVLVACSALAAAPATASAARHCAGAGRTLEQIGADATRAATLCLLNRERAERGMRALHTDARLTQAAQAHSNDMVAQRYFAHESRDGSGFGTRIRRSGWTRHRRSYSIGENIAYGSGGSATPRAIVAAWMRSPGHRANILTRGFHEIGIGVAAGTPDGGPGATYATDFGS